MDGVHSDVKITIDLKVNFLSGSGIKSRELGYNEVRIDYLYCRLAGVVPTRHATGASVDCDREPLSRALGRTRPHSARTIVAVTTRPYSATLGHHRLDYPVTQLSLGHTRPHSARTIVAVTTRPYSATLGHPRLDYPVTQLSLGNTRPHSARTIVAVTTRPYSATLGHPWLDYCVTQLCPIRAETRARSALLGRTRLGQLLLSPFDRTQLQSAIIGWIILSLNCDRFVLRRELARSYSAVLGSCGESCYWLGLRSPPRSPDPQVLLETRPTSDSVGRAATGRDETSPISPDPQVLIEKRSTSYSAGRAASGWNETSPRANQTRLKRLL
ncbi:hypothetical protein J6590_069649 [Homalodisca vitripennis]|nr:hypothetical protein J6590_069649 [Homalodisca vitripennis]